MMRATPQMDLMAQQATVEVQGTFIPSIRDFQAVSDDVFACAGPPSHLPGASTPPPQSKGTQDWQPRGHAVAASYPHIPRIAVGSEPPPLRLS